MNAVSPAIESGNVFLPDGELWTEEFIDQFTGFPAVPHDDMVDSASQALGFLLYSNGDPGELPGTVDARLIEERTQVRQEQEMFLSPALYDPYGSDGIF